MTRNNPSILLNYCKPYRLSVEFIGCCDWSENYSQVGTASRKWGFQYFCAWKNQEKNFHSSFAVLCHCRNLGIWPGYSGEGLFKRNTCWRRPHRLLLSSSSLWSSSLLVGCFRPLASCQGVSSLKSGLAVVTDHWTCLSLSLSALEEPPIWRKLGQDKLDCCLWSWRKTG